MSRKTIPIVAAAAIALATGMIAKAAPTIDGTLDAEYGSPLAVQTNATGFGDSSSGAVDTANGSELDAAYGEITGGNLYLFLAGNLETNFNKVDIFIDSHAGGMNRLSTIPNNQGNFNNMAGDGTTTGLRFDAPFAADHWVSVTAGNTPTTIFVDYADLNTLAGNFAGQTTPASDGTLTAGNGGPASLKLTFNDSNTAGVTSSTAPNDAASVKTGIELSVSLADLGYTGGDILVSAFVNGSNQDFLSNQVLGGLPAGTGNPGGDGAGNFNGTISAIDFQTYAGNQFFTVAGAAAPVPEPATTALLGIGATALLARRKRAAR